MALIKCRECNREVSDQAAACPHCGAPIAPVAPAPAPQVQVIHERSGCGRLVLICFAALVILYIIGTCAGPTRSSAIDDIGGSPGLESSPSPAVPTSAGTVKVISLQCEEAYDNGIRLEVTVENVGSTEIPFAKMFADFKTGSGEIISGDSYFSPSTIPPGARASGDVYSSRTDAKSCSLERVQAQGGAPVDLQR